MDYAHFCCRAKLPDIKNVHMYEYVVSDGITVLLKSLSNIFHMDQYNKLTRVLVPTCPQLHLRLRTCTHGHNILIRKQEYTVRKTVGKTPLAIPARSWLVSFGFFVHILIFSQFSGFVLFYNRWIFRHEQTLFFHVSEPPFFSCRCSNSTYNFFF